MDIKARIEEADRPTLQVVKVNENTYRIEDNGVRALLFIGTEKALLVDTGFGSAGSLRDVVEALAEKPIILVNTHADGDHIGCNTEFDAAHMHPAEMPYYYQNAKPDAVVSALWEGDIIDIGGRSFEVVLIPGHTPGSIALLDRRNRILLSGDSVSESPVFMFGEVRSINAYIASMEKLFKLKDLFDEIYPSHGPFPVAPSQIEKAHAAGIALSSGKLTPQEPPFPMPAKMFSSGGASFFY
ncbi:MAG: MBL fold metallo-hydrolase [Clostridiales bacterium]|nr:MBL fold metallo-hydrolase [Clostridiales bacterium]